MVVIEGTFVLPKPGARGDFGSLPTGRAAATIA